MDRWPASLLAALLAFLAIGVAGLSLPAPGAIPVADDEDPLDERHPRAPDSPLEIVYTPWTCTRCVEEEILPGPPPQITMTRLPVAELAGALKLGDDWIAIETPHYKILSTLEKSSIKFKDGNFVRGDLQRLQAILPGLKIGHDGARLTPHQRAHLHHVRVERLYSHFAALTACTTPNLGMPKKYELYLFQPYTQHHAYVDRFIGGRQDKGGIQWHFHEPPNFIVLSTCADLVEREMGRGDAALGNHVLHNMAHNLIDGHNNYMRETWAWLEEGLGHYYERRETIRYNNFCWAEGASPTEFTKPDWETTIFSLVRRGRDVPLPQWCEKLQPGELAGIENGLSWSIVKWLIETEPIRFTRMIEPIDDLENQPTAADCIERAFGVSVSVLYQRWRDHVLESYRK